MCAPSSTGAGAPSRCRRVFSPAPSHLHVRRHCGTSAQARSSRSGARSPHRRQVPRGRALRLRGRSVVRRGTSAMSLQHASQRVATRREACSALQPRWGRMILPEVGRAPRSNNSVCSGVAPHSPDRPACASLVRAVRQAAVACCTHDRGPLHVVCTRGDAFCARRHHRVAARCNGSRCRAWRDLSHHRALRSNRDAADCAVLRHRPAATRCNALQRRQHKRICDAPPPFAQQAVRGGAGSCSSTGCA